MHVSKNRDVGDATISLNYTLKPLFQSVVSVGTRVYDAEKSFEGFMI